MPRSRRASASSSPAAPAEPSVTPTWQRIAAPLAIVLIGALAYSNSFQGVFIYDDFHAIQQNSYIRSLRTAFSAPPQSSLAGRPITAATFALTYALFEHDARGYHVVNLAIHLLAALALLGVVHRAMQSPVLWERFAAYARVLALATAGLWVVHPLQTQAVTYIIQRSESLVGLFYLFTLYCSIRVMQHGRFSAWTVAAVVACAMGMGSKEVMATAPITVLLIDVLLFARSYRVALLKRWSLYLGLAAGWFILAALMAGGPRSESVGFGLNDVSAVGYFRTQPGVILHYLGLALWPRALVLDYAWPVATSLSQYLFPLLILTAAGLLTAWGVYRRRAWSLLPASFLIILAPTSSFVPINDLCFEHRMYIPLAAVILGLVLAAFLLLSRLPSAARRPIGVAACLLAIVALASRTHARNADYHDALHLWSITVQQRPDNARALSALATEYLTREQYAEAVPLYERAVELEPKSWRYLENLGRAYYKANRHQESVTAYERAIELAPWQYTLHYNLGVCFFDMKRYEDAMQSYVRALRCDPKAYQAHFNLANTFLMLNRPREAEAAYRRVLELKPGFEKAVTALERLKQREGG